MAIELEICNAVGPDTSVHVLDFLGRVTGKIYEICARWKLDEISVATAEMAMASLYGVDFVEKARKATSADFTRHISKFLTINKNCGLQVHRAAIDILAKGVTVTARSDFTALYGRAQECVFPKAVIHRTLKNTVKCRISKIAVTAMSEVLYFKIYDNCSNVEGKSIRESHIPFSDSDPVFTTGRIRFLMRKACNNKRIEKRAVDAMNRLVSGYFENLTFQLGALAESLELKTLNANHVFGVAGL